MVSDGSLSLYQPKFYFFIHPSKYYFHISFHFRKTVVTPRDDSRKNDDFDTVLVSKIVTLICKLHSPKASAENQLYLRL